MIDLHIDRTGLDHNIRKAGKTASSSPPSPRMQRRRPSRSRSGTAQDRGLWEVNPLNLFRITWKNEPKEFGGQFQAVPNYLELPPALTGVPCRIIAMVGKWFPTGCHKVGPPSAAWPPGW